MAHSNLLPFLVCKSRILGRLCNAQCSRDRNGRNPYPCLDENLICYGLCAINRGSSSYRDEHICSCLSGEVFGLADGQYRSVNGDTISSLTVAPENFEKENWRGEMGKKYACCAILLKVPT